MGSQICLLREGAGASWEWPSERASEGLQRGTEGGVGGRTQGPASLPRPRALRERPFSCLFQLSEL